MFQPGTVLDRYTVEGVLGQGGMAVVYKVRHNQLGTPHALKVLHAPNHSVKDRMLQEGRVQGQLRHYNIVPVTDLVDIAGAPGLVMEYVDGPSLEDLLERFQPTPDQVDALAVGILEGVAHAHRQGFVHRDLKPANVLLATTDAGLVPKVTDFGLAKLVRGDHDFSQTQSGMVMGTPAYMAPEQIRDSKSVDARADVFSLGVMLYELISGEKPFQGADIVALYTAITSGAYRPLTELVPAVPERMAQAIHGALVIDRNSRIQDAGEFLRVWRGEVAPVGRRETGTTMTPSIPPATRVPSKELPERFEPRVKNNPDQEITFHDDNAPTPVPVGGPLHAILRDTGRIRIAPASLEGTPPAIEIDPSGHRGPDEDPHDYGQRRSAMAGVVIAVIAVVLVGVFAVGIAVAFATGIVPSPLGITTPADAGTPSTLPATSPPINPPATPSLGVPSEAIPPTPQAPEATRPPEAIKPPEATKPPETTRPPETTKPPQARPPEATKPPETTKPPVTVTVPATPPETPPEVIRVVPVEPPADNPVIGPDPTPEDSTPIRVVPVPAPQDPPADPAPAPEPAPEPEPAPGDGTLDTPPPNQ